MGTKEEDKPSILDFMSSFVIERQLCPNSGLLNPVSPHSQLYRTLWQAKTLRSAVIFLFYKHSPAARNNGQEPASGLQPASHGPPATVQSTTVWAPAGTGWRSACNTRFPPAPATAKFQAKILGMPRIRGRISWGTEETVGLLSILLHRTMIPEKAAKREEIKH